MSYLGSSLIYINGTPLLLISTHLTRLPLSLSPPSMASNSVLFAGSHNRNEFVAIHNHEEVIIIIIIKEEKKKGVFTCVFSDLFLHLLQPKSTWRNLDGQVCEICGDEIGKTVEGDLFVACDECGFPVCRPCYEYERREGTQLCPQCKTRYKRLKGIYIYG